MTEKRTFDDIYSQVSAEKRNALLAFRANHPLSHVMHNDTDWTYITAGTGEQAVLLLVGGLRTADAAWRNIPMLTDEFRVITPTYPEAPTMEALTDGLAAVLASESIERAHVLAGSFGGMIAQVFVRRYPQLVSKLILSSTAVLNEDAVQRYRQGVEMFSPLPPEQVAEFAKEMMFDIIAPPEDDHAFYRAYLDELYSYRVSKDELLSTYHAIIDFAENYTFTADDLKTWPGEILILESDDDGTFDENARASVRVIYPQAKTHMFHGAGHSPGTTQRDLYWKIVKDFLRGAEA